MLRPTVRGGGPVGRVLPIPTGGLTLSAVSERPILFAAVFSTLPDVFRSRLPASAICGRRLGSHPVRRERSNAPAVHSARSTDGRNGFHRSELRAGLLPLPALLAGKGARIVVGRIPCGSRAVRMRKAGSRRSADRCLFFVAPRRKGIAHDCSRSAGTRRR